MEKLISLLLAITSAVILNTNTTSDSPQYIEQIIRVGISTRNFESLEYPSTRFTATGNFDIKDISTDKVLLEGQPSDVFGVTVNAKGFNITKNSTPVLSGIPGPLNIEAKDGFVKLVDILRQGKTPTYRGHIEIVRTLADSNKLSVVDVLPLDDYLKGVVPNELPVGFGFEALKAQAVAARNYAIRPREKNYPQFDICDSVACQVYFGQNSEHPLSNQAVDETAGLLALYMGDTITALYSSSSGGYSENYESAFSDPKTKAFPPDPIPYLKATPDIGTEQDLSSDEAAEKFYTTTPPSYDVDSSYYRWNRCWTRPELEKVLNANLHKFSSSSITGDFIKPKLSSNTDIGTLQDIKVSQRGRAGKAMELLITTCNGSWKVQKELNIRRLLTKDGKALPSANIVLKQNRDTNNALTDIKLYGGGFGHGVGMSQYGASYMAKNGFKFDQILKHYYNGIALGTEPVFLFAEGYSKPVKQSFASPYGKGKLWIDNEGVSAIKVVLNNKQVMIPDNSSPNSLMSLDISKYLIKGINDVVYYPPDPVKDEGLSVKMWIEVVEAK